MWRLSITAFSVSLVAMAATPVVELSIASAANPHPQVASSIAAAEKTRGGFESRMLKTLTSEYQVILAQATAELSQTLAKARRGSFVSYTEPTIKVHLTESHSDESAGVAAVERLEASRATSEAQLINSARAELADFAKVIIAEYAKQVGMHATSSSFLSKARAIDIRVLPNPKFQSITRMLKDMQARRDIGEDLVRSTVLSLELSMARELNRVASAVLATR